LATKNEAFCNTSAARTTQALISFIGERILLRGLQVRILGIANFPGQKAKQIKGFTAGEILFPTRFCLQQKGIERDEKGRNMRPEFPE
jgi:hypothetical protein